jgi:hypothetical protein
MRALSGPTFDPATFLTASSDDLDVTRQRSVSVQRAWRKLIVGSFLVSAPVATIAWLAGLAWAAIKVVGYALS